MLTRDELVAMAVALKARDTAKKHLDLWDGSKDGYRQLSRVVEGGRQAFDVPPWLWNQITHSYRTYLAGRLADAERACRNLGINLDEREDHD